MLRRISAACAWTLQAWATAPSLNKGRTALSLRSDLWRIREWIRRCGHRVFDYVRDAQYRRFVEVPAKNLDTDWQSFFILSARHRDPRNACQVRRHRVNVGQIHGEWIVNLLAQLKRRSRCGRRNNGIDSRKRVVEVPRQQAAYA